MRGLAVVVLIGCTSAPDNGDVVGPFTGETRRFVVDSFAFATSNAEAAELAADLDGDGYIENQLGQMTSLLASFDDLTEHGDSMIAAGAIASWVEIQADNFIDDRSVSVRYVGADGEDAVEVGGTLDNGVFASNRTATTSVPGSSTLHLPVFVDADPSIVQLVGMEIDMTSDGDGYDAIIRGAVPGSLAINATILGIDQMIAAAPRSHLLLLSLIDDPPRDFIATAEEIRTSSLIASLLAPDVELAGSEALSFAFRVHLSPCPAGSCTGAPPEPCFDRVLDGDETDVDCGGSCRPCTGAASCAIATDCETEACDGGTCRAPACDDGIRDGFETDVDCGSTCAGCAVGQTCWADTDCDSGECGEPCEEEDPFDCPLGWGFDTCR